MFEVLQAGPCFNDMYIADEEKSVGFDFKPHKTSHRDFSYPMKPLDIKNGTIYPEIICE